MATLPLEQPRLLVISAAPASRDGDHLVLDKKFAEGMRLYAAGWPGRVACLLTGDGDQPFGGRFDPATLPFDVRLHPPGVRIGTDDLADTDVILCSGDDPDKLHLAAEAQAAGKALIYTIENIPQTRRQIIWLERGRSALRKLKSTLSMQRDEIRRRRAFALARGLQANGHPAAETYRAVNAETLLYLDNRIDARLLGTADEMAARHERLRIGGPLRIIHSGRLEPIKGAQDLIAVARRLVERGVDLRLDIFGDGSLGPQLRQDAASTGLNDRITFHGIVDFASELVPFARREGDIFLSCHRQSDPSCTYLESMGCGLAIAGYDNRMWAGLAHDSDAGWTATLGKPQALADVIADAAGDRAGIARRCDNALAYAGAHLFEAEFTRRLDHLARLAE